MSTRDGTYSPFLGGVSQQTPQERTESQLGSQTNMVSDIVAGLRRRGGVKFNRRIADVSKDSYIRMVELAGTMYVCILDTTKGLLTVVNFATGYTVEFENDYFIASSKLAIKTTVSRDNFFMLNTEKIPEKIETGLIGMNPNRYGYFNIRSSAFSKFFSFEIEHPAFGLKTISFKTADSSADQATPEWVATHLYDKLLEDVDIALALNIIRVGSTIALEVKDTSDTRVLVCESTTGSIYVAQSGASRVVNKADLLGTLPTMLDGYIMAVGNTGNSSYFRYSNALKKWEEVGAYSKPYSVINMPYYLYLRNDMLELTQLDMVERVAGDDDNNPLPKFIGYGLTGIGSYQSRLVLLSGAYVSLSKTTEFNQFMRTTVTELLDDDPIEVSSASLSSAQFEYCLPYNKDLVLIARTQQAVIPANSTVLTPKNAVIYPSTKVELSLACEPQVVSRSLYYTYQRGTDFYQVGEFIPNTYTDAQYFNQNLTDHLPLYATGLCTSMATSTTNNMAVFVSNTETMLVNQFYWQGEERAQMAFHQWVYPHPVIHAEFIQEFLVTFMIKEGDLIIGTQNVQLNQLDDKPIPYLDMYDYCVIDNGSGDLPLSLWETSDLVAVIYDHKEARHKEVHFDIVDNVVKCPYEGTIAMGVRYTSEYTLTPPYVKDQNGKVIGGSNTTLVSLRMEFQNTGQFNVTVADTMGSAYSGDMDTAFTWSEAQLGYSWVNSIGSVLIPCRTLISSTKCTVSTSGTTDLNLLRTRYLIRLNRRV